VFSGGALPEDFVRLAASEICAIEAMRHRTRPLYGVQFHPERYTDDHPDGRAILANFFRLAGLGRPAAAAPVHA
jgi:GMP synthase (glutamine-hydrolysing)